MRADDLPRDGLLGELPDHLRAQLALRMRRQCVPEGEAVVREGEPGDRFYVVLDGSLGVSQESMGPRRILRRGDHFGEVAVALGTPRTATVHALTEAELASCDRAAFDELVRPLFADE